jgi:hypothetical protein
MVDELVRSEGLEVDITDFGGPFQIVHGRVFVFVLDPPSFQKGILQIAVLALHNEHFATLNSH